MSFRKPPSDVDRMTSLRVGNLPFRTTSEVARVVARLTDRAIWLLTVLQELQPLFEKYGDVGDIYLPVERGSGRSRGFAFVRYYEKRDAEVRCWRENIAHYSLAWTRENFPWLWLLCILSRHGGVSVVGVNVDCWVLARWRSHVTEPVWCDGTT